MDGGGVVALTDVERAMVGRLRAGMVEHLTASGVLRSPGWAGAFAAVPRHVFMPRYFARTDDGRFRLVDAATGEASRAQWLRDAYENTSWVTQLDARPVEEFAPGVVVSGEPTCSTTQPDVMAGMLEALAVSDGARVLEIGTGTGYNAALLARRLGEDAVSSIDIDGGLVEAARAGLAACGLRPTLATVDGVGGLPVRAPFDRIIATCAVRAVPYAWLEQTAPGGLVLANLSGGLNGGGLALLTVHDARHAAGRLLPDLTAYFMSARAERVPGAERPALMRSAARREGTSRATDLGPDVLDVTGFGFLARIALGRAARVDVVGDDGTDTVWLLDPTDGSALALATTPDGALTATETGPRAMWRAVERAHRTWTDVGKPGLDHYRVIVDGPRQHVRLGDDGPRWYLGEPHDSDD